jgi:prepilin-type N-terminal cleavage/methylation domain-containing protein
MLMLVIGRTNKNGFTLIELLVVLIIIGIASSYIFLNTSVLNFIKLHDHSIENSFQLLSEESILTGKTIYWYASKAEQKFYILNQDNQTLEVIEIDGLSLLDNYSDQTVIRVKTANGGQYELDTDISETPLISFYPSGENSGAIIDINDNEQLIQIVISQNGFISTKINSQ